MGLSHSPPWLAPHGHHRLHQHFVAVRRVGPVWRRPSPAHLTRPAYGRPTRTSPTTATQSSLGNTVRTTSDAWTTQKEPCRLASYSSSNQCDCAATWRTASRIPSRAIRHDARISCTAAAVIRSPVPSTNDSTNSPCTSCSRLCSRPVGGVSPAATERYRSPDRVKSKELRMDSRVVPDIFARCALGLS